MSKYSSIFIKQAYLPVRQVFAITRTPAALISIPPAMLHRIL
jgi:hypothetical protein